jgi:two-component system response regulator FlrC
MSLRCRPARAARRHSAAGASRHAGLRASRAGGLELCRRAAERKLLQHDWPGNARELTNIVQRAAWLAAAAASMRG